MYNCVPSDGRITRANQATVAAYTGSIVKLDTSDVSEPSITVTCTVTDDRGLRAATNAVVKVELPPPPVTAKPKPKPRKRPAARKPADQKDKTVVTEGSDAGSNEQLSAGIPEDAATQQRRSTAQLRETTESNLRSITRQLNSDEQAVVQQVKMFLSQSRAADTDGDIERAYRLALKAQLLSEELAKH
jgi:hypothetical protein